MSTTYSAGIATAYGAAVRGGYTGTYEEWCALMADYANVGQRAEQAATAAAASASAASTSATNAAASASAASQDATTASTAASTATTKATTAAASATNAAASEAAAATSETNAASSATAAAASEAAARAVEESIPEDYTTLSNDVDDLKAYVRQMSPLLSAGPAALLSIPDAAPLPAESAVANVGPTQSGSGTPSPENVREFVGYTGANVYHGADQTTYDTISVTFPSSAGTVYGGTLDLVAGTLTVDKAYAALNDSSKWTTNTGSSSYNFLYDVNFSDRKKTSSSFSGLLCSYCQNAGSSSVDTVRWTSASSNKMGMKLTSGTLTQVQTDATAGKIAIVYDLAEPVVYTLDPVTLTLLRGANVVWADCGDMSVIYRADLPTYIDERTRATQSLIAGVETTMTASRAYAVGELLISGDALYKVIAQIASGATLTPGTNVTSTTVAEQLILLANA